MRGEEGGDVQLDLRTSIVAECMYAGVPLERTRQTCNAQPLIYIPGRHNKRPTRTCSGRSRRTPKISVTNFDNAKDGRIDWIDLLFFQLPSEHGVAAEPSKPERAPTSVSDSGSRSGTDRLSTYKLQSRRWRGVTFPIFQWPSDDRHDPGCREFVTIRSPPGGG